MGDWKILVISLAMGKGNFWDRRSFKYIFTKNSLFLAKFCFKDNISYFLRKISLFLVKFRYPKKFCYFNVMKYFVL
jgi:hypothetical protein